MRSSELNVNTPVVKASWPSWSCQAENGDKPANTPWPAGVSHLSMVVNIAPGQYPEIAEMGQFDFNPVQAGLNRIRHVRSPYIKRGWTWSEMHHRWLQEGSPNIKAYLLHFNGGAYVPKI